MDRTCGSLPAVLDEDGGLDLHRGPLLTPEECRAYTAALVEQVGAWASHANTHPAAMGTEAAAGGPELSALHGILILLWLRLTRWCEKRGRRASLPSCLAGGRRSS